MNRIYKGLLSCLAGLVVLTSIVMLAPRTANAVIATLVQVVNTPSSPASTLDNSKAATLNVHLICLASFGPYKPCSTLNESGGYDNFTVPAGQYFVITTVDILDPVNVFTADADLSVELLEQDPVRLSALQRTTWVLPKDNATHQFQYSTGLVIRSGRQVKPIPANSDARFRAEIHGYLTAE